MNFKRYHNYIMMVTCSAALLFGCTKLEEKPYDIIVSSNFLQTRDDVVRDFLRSFEHGYWSITRTYVPQENSSDELMTPNRQGDWYDGGVFLRAHYHTWTPNDWYTSDPWNALYQGIALATNSLEDIQAIDPVKFNMTDAEKSDFVSELRVLRAWYHLRAFDLYRNIEIIDKVKGENKGKTQATPQETFSFIEKELLESVDGLPTRETLGSQGIGRWTKGAAMTLLSRLYLNAKVYIGQDKFTECAKVCQDIIDGKYGSYALESRWDAIFDYDNAQSSEMIFGFPSSFGRTHWHYSNDMFWWAGPYKSSLYFGFTDWGDRNTKFALQPGRDIQGNELPNTLGKPFIKFNKYSDDVRLKLYKNLSDNTREGMFLFGYLNYTDKDGKPQTVKSTRGYTVYLRDQVGYFLDTPPNEVPADVESNMNHADQNSGICVVKYPFYPSTSTQKIAASFAEIRLSEVYYTLAECKYRLGDKAAASVLLNKVRARYYPAGSPSLYPADGSKLTDQEMLDEWGREFLCEGRRRTDMIRWGVFCTGTWWDKTPDADNHTEIFPIGQSVMNINPQLVQNPGYN